MVPLAQCHPPVLADPPDLSLLPDPADPADRREDQEYPADRPVQPDPVHPVVRLDPSCREFQGHLADPPVPADPASRSTHLDLAHLPDQVDLLAQADHPMDLSVPSDLPDQLDQPDLVDPQDQSDLQDQRYHCCRRRFPAAGDGS